jgi:hypothetical protein
MKSGSVHSQRSTCRPPVIALHCSGAGASQWHSLAEALGGDYEVLAPEHYGAATSGAWTGEHSFTLADDAAAAIALMRARTKFISSATRMAAVSPWRWRWRGRIRS